MSDSLGDYKCELQRLEELSPSKSIKWTRDIKGTFVSLPAKTKLFITQDGSVFFAHPKKKRGEWDFESVESLAKTVNNTLIIENFSDSP